MSLQERIHLLIEKLSVGLYEKEDILSLALLSTVAGESLFLLGPPGVAKSMIARRLRFAFGGNSRAFEYLLNRFSTPDEIFGPVSITGLKDDKYHRLVEGYLPDAQVVFLDEIWKASPSILNTLLTVLNERIYRNGRNTLRLPLRLLIAASNELPTIGEGLEALWDRFLVRCEVLGIQQDDHFDQMLQDPTSGFEDNIDLPDDIKISDEEIDRWSDASSRVRISSIVLSAIHQCRRLLANPDEHIMTSGGQQNNSLYVSDRRWKKSMSLLRACAFLNNVSQTQLADFAILSNVLWNEPCQQPDINQLLSRAISSAITEDLRIELNQERLDALRDELKSVRQNGATSDVHSQIKKVRSFYYQLQHPSVRPILMYISEFENLPTNGEKSPFILIDDRKNTGGQILKRYEKSRYPGIFPKDIIQVSQVPGGVVINGREYHLLREDKSVEGSDSRQNVVEVQTEILEALKRVKSEIEAANLRFLEFRKEQENYAQSNVFLNATHRSILQKAFQSVDYAISRLSGDAAELCHTFHI